MTEQRDELAAVIHGESVYSAEHGCEFYIGTEELADVILASDFIKRIKQRERGPMSAQQVRTRLSEAGDVRRVERVTLTRIVVCRGTGMDSSSVFREVVYLFDDDGRCVSENDPCADPPKDEPEPPLKSDERRRLRRAEAERDRLRDQITELRDALLEQSEEHQRGYLANSSTSSYEAGAHNGLAAGKATAVTSLTSILEGINK